MAAAVVVLTGMTLPACGGSSSETPPPLPPHPLNDAYRTQRAAAPAKRVQAQSELPMGDEEEIVLEDEGPPAPATWGNGPRPPSSATRAPAPK